MLIDLRIYTFHPGKLADFMKLAEAEILPLQARHCGNCIFYSTTETGTLNQLIQAWAYADAADRDRRRAALWADPEWQRLGAIALPWIAHQENRLLKPAAFSPMKWA
ncbi:MAG: NIPSNAP family protein [Burkholderiales bacterium]|nr:NIPSNAP family protein [Burkholderiales bacterium]